MLLIKAYRYITHRLIFFVGKTNISGLKKYSNWPTYPQLYANGELIGGLDIVKELVESGELESQLPQQESLEDR